MSLVGILSTEILLDQFVHERRGARGRELSQKEATRGTVSCE